MSQLEILNMLALLNIGIQNSNEVNATQKNIANSQLSSLKELLTGTKPEAVNYNDDEDENEDSYDDDEDEDSYDDSNC